MIRTAASTLLIAMPSIALAQAADVKPQESDDVIVISRKLNSIAISVTRDAKGRDHCALSETTGMKDIDALLCKTTIKCVRQGAQDQDRLKACVGAQRAMLADRIARARSRQAGKAGA